MIRVVLATSDQGLGQELQRTVLEVEDTEVAFIAVSTAELSSVLLSTDVDVAIVHDLLGPEPVLSVIRDLSVRRPATAMLLASRSPDADQVAEAMEAGARGLVALPATYSQLEARLAAGAAWSTRMRRALAQGSTGGRLDDEGGRGRLIGVAGAKGGVGTTTVATHLALDVARTVVSTSVCLVDLDLEKGDVPGHVEVRHRLGISDLARVADDLSAGTVADAMTQHSSGVDLLLAPPDIRDVEQVTPQALRQIVAALRRQYDLVLVDLGSHVTPAQATVIELVDEVVLVVNPDVASMRGMRRTINAWESLGVAKEPDVRVLLNRSSKQVTVSADTVRQLTKAAVLPVTLAAGFRRLEPALNARDPLAVRNPQWWNDLRTVGREVGLVPVTTPARGAKRVRAAGAPGGAPGGAPEGPRARPAGVPMTTSSAVAPRPGRQTSLVEADGRDSGAITLETVGVLPVLAAVLLLVAHLAMIGAGSVLQAHAAGAATRAASIGQDPQAAARDSLPAAFADEVRVTQRAGSVRVTMGVPGIDLGFPGVPTEITTTREVVPEP